MNNEALRIIFEQIKDGDALAFLADGIAQYPIPLVTGEPASHCCKVWLVSRSENEVSFNISEQLFVGGRFDRVKIIKQGDLYYAENYHRLNDSKKLYFSSLINPLTPEQHALGLQDAIGQIGKKYGYLSLIFGFEFLEKIFSEKLRNKISKFLLHSLRVCSTHVAIQDAKMGLITLKNELFYYPIEAISTPIYRRVF